MFAQYLSGSRVDLQLNFKAPNLSENEKSVKKARAFYVLLRRNIRRVHFLDEFCGIKDVVQMKETMEGWLRSAEADSKAVYYIYPHGEDQCVGCLMLKKQGNVVETSAWTDVEQTGKGYYEDSRRVMEKFLFANGVKEIISRFYIGNPSCVAVEKGVRRLNYAPCEFKGIDTKPGDEKIFKTYHKTAEMYVSEMARTVQQKLHREVSR